MPVNAVNLTTNGSNVDASSYNTASITPGKKCLILAWVWGIGASTPAAPTLTGNGLTWVQVVSVTNGSRRLTLFRAMDTVNNPTAGAVTINFGATATGCTWSIVQFSNVVTTGTNGSGAIVQNATNSATATSLTVTLAAFASSNNATAAGFGSASNAAITSGSGFTQLGNRNQGSPAMAGMSQWRVDNDTTADASFTTSVANAGIAVEIAAGPAGSSIPTTNLALWLKSDAGVTLVSGRVSNWADQSGNGRDFSQSTAGNRPYFTEVLEGKTVLSAFGTGESLSSSWTPATGSYSVFAVVRNRRTVLTNNVDTVISATDTGFGGLRIETFNYFNNATQKRIWNAGGTVTPYKNGFFLSTADVTRIATDEWFILGSLHDTITETMVAATIFTNIYSVVCHGDIAELIIYTGLLTDTERYAIDGYLAERWGQQHPSVAEYSIVCAGDSLTQGYPLDIDGQWSYKLWNLLGATNRYYMHNIGVDGLTAENVDYNAGIADGVDSFNFDTSTVIFILWAGTNDLYADSVDAATTFGRVKSCINNRRRTNKYKYFILGNVIPRINDGGFATYNSYVASNLSQLTAVGLDTLVDFATDAAFNQASDSTNTTNYQSDQIHLKDPGQVKVAALFYTAVINTIAIIKLMPNEPSVLLSLDNGALDLSTQIFPVDESHSLTVDTSTVTQSHVLPAQAGSHGLTADTSTISQAHVLPVQDGSHGLVVDTSTVSQSHVLPVQDGSHGLVVDTSTVSQSHVLPVQDGSHGLTVDTSTISQAHVLPAQDGSHGLTADTSTISQAHVLPVQDGSHGLTADTSTVNQTHVLPAQNGSHELIADTSTISQTHVLPVQDGSHGLTSDTTSLTLPNALAPVDIAFPISTDSTSITQVHGVDTQDCAIGHSLDTVTISQLHDVTASDIAHGLQEEATSLTQNHVITGQSGLFLILVDTVSIGQLHEMTASDIAHALSSDVGSIVQVHLIGTQDGAMNLLVDSTILSQLHNLSSFDLTHPVREDTTNFFQGSDILPDRITHSVSTDSTTLSQLHVIGVQDGALSVSVDSPGLSQNHNFSPLDAGLAVQVDTTGLSQNHAISGQDAALTLLVDTTTLSQLHDVTASDLSQPMRIDAANLIQDVGLTVTDLTIPEFIGVVGPLSQNHVLTPQEARTGMLLDNGTLLLVGVTPASRTITIKGRLMIQVSGQNRTITIPD